MTTRCEIRVVRCTDGTIDLEMCEFDDAGRIVGHLPWEQCWFAAFLGGSKGELAPWLKEQVINAFLAGANNAWTANWMANTTVMQELPPRCTELAVCPPRHPQCACSEIRGYKCSYCLAHVL